jgi:tRNA G18 (ribose-2'-O)-methylase SpoU
LRRLVAERCDVLAHLPMRGSVGSLNASVAAAVGIYRLCEADLYGSSRIDSGKSG